MVTLCTRRRPGPPKPQKNHSRRSFSFHVAGRGHSALPRPTSALREELGVPLSPSPLPCVLFSFLRPVPSKVPGWNRAWVERKERQSQLRLQTPRFSGSLPHSVPHANEERLRNSEFRAREFLSGRAVFQHGHKRYTWTYMYACMIPYVCMYVNPQRTTGRCHATATKPQNLGFWCMIEASR